MKIRSIYFSAVLAALALSSSLAQAQYLHRVPLKGLVVTGSSSGQPAPTTPPVAPVTSASLTAVSVTNFGNVAVGSTSDLNFTYQNTGNQVLTNLAAQVSGTGLSVLSSDCGTLASPRASLAAGAYCTVTVRYQPTAAGSLTGALDVISQAPSLSRSLPLTGSAIVPVVAITGSLSVPSTVTVGRSHTSMTLSADNAFILRNTSAVTQYITVNATGIPGEVFFRGGSSGAACGNAEPGGVIGLVPGATCSSALMISFEENGPVSGEVTLQTSDGLVFRVPVQTQVVMEAGLAGRKTESFDTAVASKVTSPSYQQGGYLSSKGFVTGAACSGTVQMTVPAGVTNPRLSLHWKVAGPGVSFRVGGTLSGQRASTTGVNGVSNTFDTAVMAGETLTVSFTCEAGRTGYVDNMHLTWQ